MTEHRITCITKPDTHSTVDRITHVGYDGYHHKVQDVIRKIDARTDSFYTLVQGEHADVHVVRPRDGRDPYIRTSPDADGEKRDNLLYLPQCIVN